MPLDSETWTGKLSSLKSTHADLLSFLIFLENDVTNDEPNEKNGTYLPGPHISQLFLQFCAIKSGRVPHSLFETHSEQCSLMSSQFSVSPKIQSNNELLMAL